MGRIPPRAHRRIYFHDDSERGAADSSRICGHAPTVGAEVNVCSFLAAHDWMRAARFLRSARVPGFCKLALEVVALLGADRVERPDRVCRKSVGYVCFANTPCAMRTDGNQNY